MHRSAPPATLPIRILRYLYSLRTHEATTAQIARRLHVSPHKVTTACYRMRLQGRLGWVKWGTHCLPGAKEPA